MRIAPDKIMTDDPVILRHMSAPRSNFRRGTFYDGMSVDPNFNSVLSERDEKLHNTLRAKLIRGVRIYLRPVFIHPYSEPLLVQ